MTHERCEWSQSLKKKPNTSSQVKMPWNVTGYFIKILRKNKKETKYVRHITFLHSWTMRQGQPLSHSWTEGFYTKNN